MRDSENLFSVCFFDLDRFKNLNDSRGHDVGDKLLIALSGRINGILRSGDTLARMGGDEFIMLFNNLDGIDGALNITERILSSLQKPFEIDNNQIYTNASFGLCMSAKEYTNSDDMIRDADIAMYRAKSSGKNCIDVFNPDMHKYAFETMQIENDLRLAIEKNQLEIYYQPVIDIINNRIDGFEALLRWKHPSMGWVSPERFIPIAEHIGLINPLGQWVLENACAQNCEWNKQFSPDNSFSIAINLSAIQLTEKDIHSTIKNVLDNTLMNPSKLHLEVTETALINQKELAQSSMEKIRQNGISLSIDDFGKGYCSLTYLQEFDKSII